MHSRSDTPVRYAGQHAQLHARLRQQAAQAPWVIWVVERLPPLHCHWPRAVTALCKQVTPSLCFFYRELGLAEGDYRKVNFKAMPATRHDIFAQSTIPRVQLHHCQKRKQYMLQKKRGGVRQDFPHEH